MADKPEVAVEEPNEFEDRRSDILAAVEAAEKSTPAPTPKAAKESAPAVPETATTSDSTVQAGAEPANPTGSAPVAPAAQEVAAAPDQPEKLEPPSNWSKADKERFAEWPEPAQKQFIERFKAQEADYTRKTMEVAEFRKEYGAVDEMFTPYKMQLRQAGLTPATAVRAWMAAEQALNNPNTRDRAFLELARGYQIDLGKLAGNSAGAEAVPGRMPTPAELANMSEQQQLDALLKPYLAQAVSPYQQQIEELRQQVAQSRQFQDASVNGQRQQFVQGIVQEVSSFAAAKDATGNLLHPYFQDVENDMALMLSGYHQARMQAPPLEEIYQRAVRANPSTYERLTAQQKTAADTQRTAEARAKATQARRAGSSVTGAPSGGQPKPNGDAGPLTIRDSIMAAMEASAP